MFHLRTAQQMCDYCEKYYWGHGISKSWDLKHFGLIGDSLSPDEYILMERYSNTLKNECTNLFEFPSEDSLYLTVEEFAYVTRNHLRPYFHNAYLTPWQDRSAQ